MSGQVRLSTEWLAPQRAYIGAVLVDGFDPAALVSCLEGMGMRYQGEVRGAGPSVAPSAMT